MVEINEKQVLNAYNFKDNCHTAYTSYLVNPKNIICGCGSNISCGFLFHMSNAHGWSIPKGTSHIVLRCKIMKKINPVPIYLPVQP